MNLSAGTRPCCPGASHRTFCELPSCTQAHLTIYCLDFLSKHSSDLPVEWTTAIARDRAYALQDAGLRFVRLDQDLIIEAKRGVRARQTSARSPLTSCA